MKVPEIDDKSSCSLEEFIEDKILKYVNEKQRVITVCLANSTCSAEGMFLR